MVDEQQKFEAKFYIKYGFCEGEFAFSPKKKSNQILNYWREQLFPLIINNYLLISKEITLFDKNRSHEVK